MAIKVSSICRGRKFLNCLRENTKKNEKRTEDKKYKIEGKETNKSKGKKKGNKLKQYKRKEESIKENRVKRKSDQEAYIL